jgi:hypothetical protein
LLLSAAHIFNVCGGAFESTFVHDVTTKSVPFLSPPIILIHPTQIYLLFTFDVPILPNLTPIGRDLEETADAADESNKPADQKEKVHS